MHLARLSHRARRHWLTGTALSLALSLGSHARAQTAPAQAPAPTDSAAAPDAAADSGVGDIIVTAQKRPETLQRTPIAVTAIGGDAIQQQQISTFRDLSGGRVPGLLAPKRSTAQTTQQYSIRGIGEIDTYPEPAVAVYVDDVYLARTVGSLYDTPDLERVEVLRGPQGTLYGRNSSAGAIRFITKDPTATPSLDASATLGSFKNVDLKARVNGAILADDALNGALTVIRHTRDGWQHSVPLDRDFNDTDLWVVRGKLKSQVAPGFTLTLAGDAMFDRATQSYYTPVNQPDGKPGTGNATDPDLTWSDTLPYNRTTTYGGSLTAKYEIDQHFTLKSVTAYRGLHGPIYYDNDGVTAIKGDSLALFWQHQITEELNLNGEFDRWNFVAGLYFFKENFHNHRLSQSAGSPLDNVGTVTHTNNWLNTTSWAVFGQANFKATDRLTFTVGGRWTTDRRRFHNIGQTGRGWGLHDPQDWNYDPDRFFVQYPTGASASATFSSFDVEAKPKSFARFTPKLGAQIDWTRDIFQYVSFSQGFKSGGYDLRSVSLVGSSTPYLPQLTTTYETGLKTRLFGGRATFNISAYYNDIKDFQVRATATAALGVVTNQLINAGKAASWGAEAELTVVPADGLTLTGSAAWLRTKYRTFTATLPANVAGRKTLLGLDFPYSPEWQFGGSFNYRLPLALPGALRVGADVQYESSRYADIYNTPQLRVGAQTYVNGTINYTAADQSWSIGASVRNLFNLRRGQFGGYAPSNAGVYPLYYRAYNEPRTFNVTVSKSFH
ncbi:TonB-dependent receptor [Novosphingobium olei]|uniref:TonB-dependent receptor n=1 Tax=Novosphingobium olei TaxID=2728851 RepID=A0A7Y0BNA3_9SPHN|nr:TonB-dependent receptor [Novosphingobium olei]NML93355.1 TonB-dependent receptor [Novosphingobium olei]